MNLRRLPLPAVFALFVVLAPAFLGTLLAVRTGSAVSGIWDHPRPITFVALGAFALGMATLATILEARGRNRGKPPEESRYDRAIRTGQITGDVTGWADRVRRRLREEAVGLLGIVYFLGLAGFAVVNGPRWAAVAVLALTAVSGWNLWKSRRRLKALLKDLDSQDTGVGSHF